MKLKQGRRRTQEGQRRFFYGWLIVMVGGLVTFSEVGTFNPVLSVFMKPMSEEFGWSRVTFAAAITIGGVGAAILAPFVGPLIDRYGSRTVILVGVAIDGLTLMGLGLVGEVWQFYLAYAIGRIATTAAISLAVSVAVANWFIKKRGRAMGMTSLGSRAGHALLPLLAQLSILTQGWRPAWTALGLMVLVVGLVPTALFVRRRPEDLGLLPDGATAPSLEPSASFMAGSQAPMPLEEPSFTRREAVRTTAFWFLVPATALAHMVGGGLNLHQFPYFTDRGIPEMVAVGALTVYAAVGAVGALFWGYLADRFHVRPALSAVFFLASLAVIFLMTVQDAYGAYLYAVIYGFAFGGFQALIWVIWANYYGRSSLGSIRGLVSPFHMIPNAFGPLFAGWVFDTTGSYIGAFSVFALAYFLVAIAFLLAKPPQYQPVSAPHPERPTGP